MGNAVVNFNISDAAICQPHENQLYLTISAVCVILMGLAFVFAGNKIIRAVALLLGLVTGFCVTYALLDKYSGLAFWWKVGISAGVGLFLGVLCCVLLFLAVALMGFALGVVIASLILATPLGPKLFAMASWAPLVTMGLCGLCLMIISLVFQKYLLMFATAIAGSFAIGVAVDCAWLKTHFIALVPRLIAMEPIPSFTDDNKLMYIMLIGIGVLGLSGFIVQWLLECRAERIEREKNDEMLPMSRDELKHLVNHR